MGLKGTAAAKEAAAIVLADDNFASIAHAVEEGRTVYGNIRKAILYILPTSVAEAAVLVVAIVAGFAMPITPVQILWVNMVTTTLLSLVIAFEPPEQDVMRRPPRSPGEPLLSRLLVWRTALVAVLVAGGVIWLHQIELARGMSEAAARATAVNALVIALVFYLFNMRYMDRSSFRRDVLTGNRYALPAVGALLLLQAGFTYLPAMQALFGTAAIDATAWLLCVLVGAAVFVVVEIEKAWLAKSRKAAP
jgi:magnesium-transporting ATPase (P-type)